ncbi:MAG: hypothetical protein HUJ56_04480, partial [Erysipelotrichaceae bacterium]|nr:hypothetical protein [Erysipelotrichaceae bacterium]
YDSEVIDFYYAKIDQKVGQHLDEDERIHVYRYTLDEIIEMVMNKELSDGKTIAMAFMVRELKRQGKI